MTNLLSIVEQLASFSAVQLTILVFARCLGMTLFSPVFAGGEVSKFIRVLAALTLTVLVAPTVLSDVETMNALDNVDKFVAFIPLVLQETLWGCLMGLTLKIFFEGVYLAGETISKVGGISVASTFDSNVGAEIAAVSKLLFWSALALFIVMHGCELFLDGFLSSFTTVVPGATFQAERFVESAANILGCSFVLAMKIAAPVCLSTLTVYLVMGILGKVFPQMNLLAIGFGLNSLLTLVIMILGVGVFCLCFQDEVTAFLERGLGVNG